MYTNKVGEVVIDENDAVEALLRNKRIKRVVSKNTDWVQQYNNSANAFDINRYIEHGIEFTGTTEDYVIDCISEHNWNMPKAYNELNIIDYVLSLSPKENYNRCFEELEEFEKRGLIPLLKFLVYLVDTAKENNIVLGVGRGSSVASYVLYLLGVHKIDSLKYNLDIKEFLK
jgi:DNA polymerase III alpha subunit